MRKRIGDSKLNERKTAEKEIVKSGFALIAVLCALLCCFRLVNECFADESLDDAKHENQAEIYMSCSEDPDGNYYYREDNCAVRVLFRGRPERDGGRFFVLLDGDPLTEKEAVSMGMDDCFAAKYSSDEVITSVIDGEHEILAFEETADGTVLPVPVTMGQGVVMTETGGRFILDLEPPVVTLTMENAEGESVFAAERDSRAYL